MGLEYQFWLQLWCIFALFSTVHHTYLQHLPRVYGGAQARNSSPSFNIHPSLSFVDHGQLLFTMAEPRLSHDEV